jgi:hypothetical protein
MCTKATIKMRRARYNSGMKHRKLRIAWSVAWGIAAVILIVLWARSYHFDEMVDGPLSGGKAAFVQSRVGRIMFGVGPVYPDQDDPWQYRKSMRFRPDHIDQIMQATYKDECLGFQVRIGQQVIFHVPHWICILACSSLSIVAARPWLGYRFNLRTLLIATTLVAVGLGLIVWASK